MICSSTYRRAAALSTLLTVAAFPCDSTAQTREQRRPTSTQLDQPLEDGGRAEQLRRVKESADAQVTRNSFTEILQRHPPSVGRVLKIDPTLMQNDEYLQTYPQIREFLQQHPEVVRNAPYYLEGIHSGLEHWRGNEREQMMAAILGGLAGFTAFIIILSTLVWIIRTVIDHRRWNRLSKIQAEVHTKLMDRFASNDELLTYVQTPSGRRFLESGPSPLQESAPAMSAPFARILWSVQIGAVLLVGGSGLLFLSGRAIEEVREFFYIAGCLASAVGAGFIVSAAAAYVLSRRLGLLERPTHDHA